ncbi:MAG: phosphoesterase [Flavobacteriales bacterium]|nr:MAG: phosphoesterase [Flavobacteriales bacterium]
MLKVKSVNTKINDNYTKVKAYFLVFPLLIITSVVVFLGYKGSLSEDAYTAVQKDWFFYFNAKLSQFPHIEYNLTQFGDAFVFLSLLSVFVLYAPKLWEGLISASLVSLVLSRVPKSLFDVPRPAEIYDESSFTIIGEKLVGYSSLPSGHSITIFTMLTVLVFAFMPKKRMKRILWLVLGIGMGMLLASTRVGVGAHHPLDVLLGGSIGIASGIIGILINQKLPLWSWVSNEKYHFVFLILFLGSMGVLIDKIRTENLVVYYVALASIVYSIYIITKNYVRKIKK